MPKTPRRPRPVPRYVACALLACVATLVRPVAAVAQAAQFDLDEVQVEGNTVLDEREIDAAVYPFLGPGRTRDDVEHARAALDELLTKKGFVTASATLPSPEVHDGVVRIRIVERTIGRLRVTGARYVAPRVIRDGAPSLAEGGVPNLAAIQADIVALNQLPDRTITPSLKTGRAPDTVDVDLKVEDHLPLHAALELNNRQSQDTNPLRLSGNVSYGNLWQRGDSASVGFQLAPQNPSDATVLTASYLYRIPGSNASILGSYLHSSSNVTTLGDTTVVGKGDIAGLRLLLPLGTSDEFTHSLAAGFDYKNITEDVGFGATRSTTPIVYYPFSVAYQAGWAGAESSTDVTGTLLWAFRGLDSGSADFDAKRVFATRNFFVVKGEATRTQSLPFGMEGYVHATAQAAPDPLVSSEQFSAGGLDTVRGYLESEALGDYGGAGQVELRSPPLARYVGAHWLTSLRLHAFADAGGVKIHQPLTGQASSAVLASVGVGARLRLFDHLSGAVEDAVALHTASVTHAGSNRVLFRLYGDF